MKAELWAVLTLAAAGASAMGRRPPERTLMTQEWKGQYGGPAEAGHDVAMDEVGWKRIWRGLGQDAPALDFNARAAVAAYAGQRPTGGFALEFEEPVRKGDDLLVRFRVRKPAGFATQAFTQPWKVVALPRPKGRVIVEAEPE